MTADESEEADYYRPPKLDFPEDQKGIVKGLWGNKSRGINFLVHDLGYLLLHLDSSTGKS